MDTTTIIIVALFALAAITAFVLFRQRDGVEIKDLTDKRKQDDDGMNFNQKVGPPKGGEPRVMQWGGGKPDASVLRAESDVEHTEVEAPMGWSDQLPGGELPFTGPDGQPVRIIERHVGSGEPEMGSPASGPPRIVMQWGDTPTGGAPPDAAQGGATFSRPAPGSRPDGKKVEPQGDAPDRGTPQDQKPGSEADPPA